METSLLTKAFASAFSILNRVMYWEIEVFGNTIFVRDIFIFCALVSLFFIVVKFISN